MLSPCDFGKNCQGATARNSRSVELTSLLSVPMVAKRKGFLSPSLLEMASRSPRFRLRREHHFAEMFAAFEITLRGASFRQREGPIDNHSKLSIVD
jgi:hypothetical protein